MGHGKTTPRQKMINMMYLVLTALLALNVSAEILNAFILIDKSIRATTENVQDKIESAHTAFVAAEKENEAKVKPWREKAESVSEKANELYDKIQALKIRMIEAADGEADEHHPEESVKKKDDNNVGGQIMLLEGEGENLKTAIEEFRAFLGEIAEGDSAMIRMIESNLSTDDIESTHGEGEKIDWVHANFDHLPLIAVISLMSKMQSDVRNVESNMMSYLLTKIDAASFKFDQIEGILKAPTSYVAVGEEYSAEIFIAASESTKKPEIYILNAPFDTATYKSGGYDDLTPMDSSQIQNGKGIFNGSTGAPGIKNVYGFIKMKTPAGTYEAYPFESKYQVVVPSFAVSPTKMNVFYIGVDNPVEISATGIKGDISASISKGSISPQGGGKYNVKVPPGATKVTVNVSADGSSLGRKEFRCKTVPDPVATVGGSRGGKISLASLSAQRYVVAELPNFDFDVKFLVTEFEVAGGSGSFTDTKKSNGNQLTQDQIGIIRGAKRGSKVYFENIKARGPDGTIRNLGSIAFTIQ